MNPLAKGISEMLKYNPAITPSRCAHDCRIGECVKCDQIHECPLCLNQNVGGAKCFDCGAVMVGCWSVRDSKGKVIGKVAGCDFNEALESARQTPLYDRYKGLTVREII